MLSLTLCERLQDFFSQLDQRVLSVFLKACDELTDILPETEQQELQETVRRLHKHWKVRGVRGQGSGGHRPLSSTLCSGLCVLREAPRSIFH